MSEKSTQFINDIRLKFQTIQETILDLRSENQLLKVDNSRLSEELELKSSAFDQVNAEFIGLKSQNNELTLLLTQKDDSTNENDQLINELVKEIDDCISLLKN
jgi:uncharacterized protein YktB (UPF0637 family)